MGCLVTGKSAFFQTPLLLGTMEKTAPVSLEHQFCQRKKSSTGGGVILCSTHAACFLRLVTSFSRRIYYVTFYEESYRERYVGNSTRRLNACDCLLQDFQSRCSCFDFQFDLYVGIKLMFFTNVFQRKNRRQKTFA